MSESGRGPLVQEASHGISLNFTPPPLDAAHHLPSPRRGGGTRVASYLVSHATRVPPCPLPVGCDTLTSEVQVCSSSAPYDAGHALWMSRGTPGIIRYWMVEDHENGARQRW